MAEEKELDLNALRDRMRSGEQVESKAPPKPVEDEEEPESGPSLVAIREAARKIQNNPPA